MNITVEDVGTCLKKVWIEIPKETVTAKLNAGFREVGRSVDLPGFRKGHAPQPLLEKKYGKYVIEQVTEELIRDAVNETLRSKELEPVGNPDFEEKPEVKKGEGMNLRFTLEVRPDFELPVYKGVEINLRMPSVTPKEVDIFLRNVQVSQGEMNDLSGDDVTQDGDMIAGDFHVYVDDSHVAGRNNGSIEVGSTTVLGVEVAAAKASFTGLKASEFPVEREFSVTLPHDFPLENYVGKDAVIKVKVKGAGRPDAPQLDDELAKKVGYESLDDMREKAREMLMQEKEAQSREDMHNRLLKLVVGQVKLEIPEQLAERQFADALEREAFNLYQQGVDDAAIEKFIEDRKEALKASVADGLKERFVVDAIAKKERIFVTEEEIIRRTTMIAQMRNMAPQALLDQMVQTGMVDQMRFELKTGKVKAMLAKKSKITKLDADGQPLTEEIKAEKTAKAEEASAE